MNAHADMLIVVRHNGLNTPRGIYRSLVSGVRKFPVFKSPKQAPINAFYYVCYPPPLMCRHPQRRFTVQRYYKKCKCASIASIIFKNDRFIYLIRAFALTQARFNEDAIVLGLKPRQMFEYTTKFSCVRCKV